MEYNTIVAWVAVVLISVVILFDDADMRAASWAKARE